eukprot:scaffold260567_cov28-Tisochrysis_lutea.AAC.1
MLCEGVTSPHAEFDCRQGKRGAPRFTEVGPLSCISPDMWFDLGKRQRAYGPEDGILYREVDRGGLNILATRAALHRYLVATPAFFPTLSSCLAAPLLVLCLGARDSRFLVAGGVCQSPIAFSPPPSCAIEALVVLVFSWHLSSQHDQPRNQGVLHKRRMQGLPLTHAQR